MKNNQYGVMQCGNPPNPTTTATAPSALNVSVQVKHNNNIDGDPAHNRKKQSISRLQSAKRKVF